MFPGGAWTTAGLTILLLLASAKAHGRQVRLLRERAGVHAVDFRKDNGPVVEAIWRMDRIRFWTAAALFAVVFVAGGLIDPPSDWTPLMAGLFGLAWAFIGGFVASGLGAFAVLSRPHHSDDAVWRRASMRGSLGWWLLVALAASLVALSV